MTTLTIPTDLTLAPRTSFVRTVRVELRKFVDTRAGFWTLVAMAVSIIGLVVAILVFGNTDGSGYADLVQYAVLPQGGFLPVLGVLAATAEWTQRTGLTTFALEPRRMRVIWAKCAAAVILGTALTLLGFLVAVPAYAVVAGSAADPAGWSLSGQLLLSIALSQAVALIGGLAMGFALQNTPAALAMVFAVPFVLNIGALMFEIVGKVLPWIEVGPALGELAKGTLTGIGWAHLASSLTVWIVLPMVVGAWRVTRSEIK